MYSIPMALVDFIPVILFLAGVIVLQKELYYKFLKWQFATFSAGGIMIFVAGLYKAIYKLLYALGICDFQRLNDIFFPLQATGFILIGFASVFYTVTFCNELKGKKANGFMAAPPVFTGTMIFVSGMILGVLGLCISFAVISAKIKKYSSMILFIVSIVFMLGMGYLSTKTFDNSQMNWIAQGVNILGQGLFFTGALGLKKAGLRNY